MSRRGWKASGKTECGRVQLDHAWGRRSQREGACVLSCVLCPGDGGLRSHRGWLTSVLEMPIPDVARVWGVTRAME